MSRHALLIGGTGAIGTYLIPELVNEGFCVDVTTRANTKSKNKNIKYIKGDGHDRGFTKALLETKDYDLIVDFMVYSTTEFDAIHKNLLDGCRHYIFLSSYRVYAQANIISENSPRLLDVSKDKTYIKTDEYALAKARQEDILKNSRRQNWTIVRPGITYSKNRFQLGNLEADSIVWRALRGKPVIIPKDILGRHTTMTWAGDVARMIKGIALNRKSYGEDYIVASSKHRTWKEVADIYHKAIGMKIKEVSNKDYLWAAGGGKYQLIYDRLYDRIIDNKKILKATGIRQDELKDLSRGLSQELKGFVKEPKFSTVDYSLQARIDKLTHSITSLSDASNSQRREYILNRFPDISKGIIKANRVIITIRQKIRIRTRIRSVPKKLKEIKHDIIRSIRILAKAVQYHNPDGVTITLTDYSNYGNIIQRFALQRFLKQSGYKFISYDHNLPIENDLKDERLKQIVEFVDKYIPRKDFDKNDNYSTYIVGSDQIWRNWWYEDEEKQLGYFFLNFVKDPGATRIAYAASFGKETLEDSGMSKKFTKEIEPLVKRFSAISARERSGAKIIEDTWGVDVEVVVDPTLLLGAESYNELIKKYPKGLSKVDGIFTYLIAETDEKNEFISNAVRGLGIPRSGIFLGQEGPLPPVEQWLKGFRDSKLVITDSFHGTVFSILNNTNFIVVENKIGGASRSSNLLRELGIEGRLVREGEMSEYNIYKTEKIDWAEVNRRLDLMRVKSSDWLVSAVRESVEHKSRKGASYE